MKKEEIKELFSNITVWKRGAERAPHKPLLLLYALAKCRSGEPRELPYTEVDKKLRELLIEFGPSRKSHHPEYPFWRLQNDGLWEITGAKYLERRKGNTDAKRSEMLSKNVLGGFTEPVYDYLRKDRKLLSSVAQEILDRNFPASIHEDILAEVGLEIDLEQRSWKKRDPQFRKLILKAYAYCCAICNFDVRLGTVPIGLEAAHIKWHQAGGPDIEPNGVALCSLHHKMFDRGAFTLSDEFRIEVSEHVNGYGGFEEWLLKFHGNQMNLPMSNKYNPAMHFLKWHRAEVFRSPAR